VTECNHRELLVTLDVHLETGCSGSATATRLGVHRNTVLHRLRRIGEITSLDLDDPDVRFLVQLALRACRRFGALASAALPDGVRGPA
jgi:DNA-binding PucR family transcriptional regulator